MRSFGFDLAELAKKLHVKKESAPVAEVGRVPFSTNQHKFKKLAFDMFQSQFDGTIWELQNEGESRFLVKRTDLDDHSLQTQSKEDSVPYRKGFWSLSQKKDAMTLSYVDVPVKEFRSAEFNFDDGTRELFADTVLDELHTNDKLVKAYLKQMGPGERKQLTQRCKRNLIDNSSRRLYALLQEL